MRNLPQFLPFSLDKMTFPSLSLEQATEAIKKILAEMDKEEIATRLAKAQAEAKGDLDEIFVKIMPLIFEIQGHVMAQYNIDGDDDGFAHFAEQLTKHEKPETEANLEFRQLSTDFKARMKKLTATSAQQKLAQQLAEEEEEEDDDDDDGDDDGDRPERDLSDNDSNDEDEEDQDDDEDGDDDEEEDVADANQPEEEASDDQEDEQ